MDVKQLIQKILSAKSLADIMEVSSEEVIKKEYRKLSLLIYPDKCKLPQASDAFAKLVELKNLFIKGKSYEDDASTFTTNGFVISYKGDKGMLEQSFKNYQLLKALKNPDVEYFHRYLPQEMRWNGEVLEVVLPDKALTDKDGKVLSGRGVPLSGITLSAEHARWILSRILEFVVWMEKYGFIHCGINPENVFVIPETHGIIVTSFYHMKRSGAKLETLSGSYQSWYPESIFSTKTAEAVIDLELTKKTIVRLLGEVSANPIKLKKTQNAQFVDFLMRLDTNAAKAFIDYRQILEKNFEKKFYPLSL